MIQSIHNVIKVYYLKLRKSTLPLTYAVGAVARAAVRLEASIPFYEIETGSDCGERRDRVRSKADRLGRCGAALCSCAWRAHIGWSGLIVSALRAIGLMQRSFKAQAGGIVYSLTLL